MAPVTARPAPLCAAPLRWGTVIYRIANIVREVAGVRWHPRPQQESVWGIVRAFLGAPCEFGIDCAYPGLDWRCGHRRSR